MSDVPATALRKTPLFDLHERAGARIVPFAGWAMPVQYRGIIEEHHAVRNRAGVFDVSHMGRVEFCGPDALAFLELLNTRNIGQAAPGMCRYSHMCRDDGGILDDVIVSRFEDKFLVVCNASNREKLLGWWLERKRGFNVEIIDRTFETAMVAIQGPEALETMDRLLPFKVSDLKRYRFKTGSALGAEYFVARSGYTGEDGVECIFPAGFTMMLATMLMSQSAEMGRPIKPIGLGARDTLRLEAGMPLYGHELTEDWDSLTSGQEWAVDLTKNFIGADVLRKLKAEGLARRIVGLELEGKRIARQGVEVHKNGTPIGVVTSGTMSPTLDRNIAMALVPPAHGEAQTTLEVDIRGTRVPARVVPLPFYKRK
jgi:aminomethyltransferase